MTTFSNVSLETIKKEAKIFFDATADFKSITPDQAANAFKGLVLQYLGHDRSFTESDVLQAAIIVKLAGKRLIDVEIHHGYKGKVLELDDYTYGENV